MTHVAVIDIGKTNAKLALVDLDTLAKIHVTTRSCPARPGRISMWTATGTSCSTR